MLNHQRLHTGEFKECICDLCGAVYKSVQVLNRHVRNAHQDLRNHKCIHCDKAFHNKQRLERHINSQHTKAKIWPCPVCQSRYDRKDNLRTHIRKNHSAVVNPDTVELHSIDNDGQIDIKPKHRRPSVHEATINPETGEMEGGPPTARSVGNLSMRAVLDRQTLIPRPQNPVHAVAQDLLSLKYGEEAGGAAQYRPLTSPDIKAEGGAAHATIRLGPQFDGHGQVAQYHIKLERPEIVMSSSAAQMMGLQRAVNNMTATRVAPQSPPASRDGPQHNMQGLQNAGYGFPHHNL